MAITTVHKGYGGKAEFVVANSSARTTTLTSDDYIVPYGKTLTVIINITTGAATPSVTPSIRGVTPLGVAYTVLTGAAITSTSAATVVLRVGDGVAEVTNLGTAIPLPAMFRIVMTAGDADSLTYSIEAEVR